MTIWLLRHEWGNFPQQVAERAFSTKEKALSAIPTSAQMIGRSLDLWEEYDKDGVYNFYSIEEMELE